MMTEAEIFSFERFKIAITYGAFAMDSGSDPDDTDAANTGFRARANLIQNSASVTLLDEMPWHMGSSNKALPPGVRLDILLENAKDEFRLHASPAPQGEKYIVKISSMNLIIKRYALQ